MGLSLVTAAAVEPVTLAEAKAHLRIEPTDDDTLITALIVAARDWCESYANRQYIEATWKYTLDESFPDVIELPRPPLLSVTNIKYYDDDGVLQTMSASIYQVSISGVCGFVKPAYDQSWPAVREQYDCIQVTYKAGYGSAAANVPETAKVAIKMLVAHLYNNREAAVEKALAEVPFGIKSLLDTHAAPASRVG